MKKLLGLWMLILTVSCSVSNKHDNKTDNISNDELQVFLDKVKNRKMVSTDGKEIGFVTAYLRHILFYDETNPDKLLIVGVDRYHTTKDIAMFDTKIFTAEEYIGPRRQYLFSEVTENGGKLSIYIEEECQGSLEFTLSPREK